MKNIESCQCTVYVVNSKIVIFKNEQLTKITYETYCEKNFPFMNLITRFHA